MVSELQKLVKYFKARSDRGASKTSIEIWQEAAEELEALIDKHQNTEALKNLNVENNAQEDARLECGCSNDEFGCQGYHGT